MLAIVSAVRTATVLGFQQHASVMIAAMTEEIAVSMSVSLVLKVQLFAQEK